MSGKPGGRMFAFGRNWKSFAARALTEQQVHESRTAFQRLFQETPLKDRSFLDIGFGQGLGSLNALSAQAQVVACDIDPNCAEALALSARYYPAGAVDRLRVRIGSILDPGTVAALKQEPGCEAGYDIVHSWGVLHHTGKMWAALGNAAGLVKNGGVLAVALYRTHWSSPVWSIIKWTYCVSPGWLQQAFVYGLYPVIYLAKLIVTGRNPTDCSRGMDFFHDVVDWVGGYPYEYATAQEVVTFVEALGFQLLRLKEAQVPTGCNEFVFSRIEKATV